MGAPRRTIPATPRRAATEKAVLEATERLLATGGSFAELSVHGITREAGISRTAFYFYFSDKRDLLVRLTEGVVGELYAQAETWFGDATAGPERLREALGAVIALYREHSVLLRAVVETAAVDEDVALFWRALVGRFVDATRARIETEPGPAGHAAGTAFALAWMTERTLYQHLTQPGTLAADEVTQALSGIWIGAVYGP